MNKLGHFIKDEFTSKIIKLAEISKDASNKKVGHNRDHLLRQNRFNKKNIFTETKFITVFIKASRRQATYNN